MLLPALLASDLHLTANPADSYRWALFPWLANECIEGKVRSLLLLGDLTDAKDYHPAELTNRVVKELVELKRKVDSVLQYKQGLQIEILLGNHDYLKGGHAYFEFLNEFPGMRFITQITESALDDGPSAIFLPHTKTPAKDWGGFDFSHYDYALMHQTIKGSVASNGQVMDGEAMPDLPCKVYSGDIHVPQVLGRLEYVGSPYHVHFGDSFKPRCVYLDRQGKPEDRHLETIRRVTLKVSHLSELRTTDLHEGDQVKLRFLLPEAEKHMWSRLRREAAAWIKDQGVELHGMELALQKGGERLQAVSKEGKVVLSSGDILCGFIEHEELPGVIYDLGLECMK